MEGQEDQIRPTPAPPQTPLAPEPVGPAIATPLEIEENGSPTPPRTGLRLAAILLTLYLALFAAALDETVVATSIPTIAAQLHSASGYAWIASAFLLADAAGSPIWARFSDIYGRKPALLGAVVMFAAASVMAAASPSVKVLIAGRAFQGFASGGLIQLVSITISDLFDMRRRTIYLGLVNLVWGFSGGVGPLVGGALTQYVSWRWCFWINLPICAATFVVLLVFLDVHSPRTGLRDGLAAFDWLGTLSFVGVVVMLLLGLDFGGVEFAWSSPTVIGLIVAAVLMGGVFLFTEKRVARFPLLPTEIFRDRSTNAAFAVGFCHGAVFIAVSYYLPLYFQSVKQVSPLRSGLLILPNTLPQAAVGLANAFVMHRTGHYREIIWASLAFLTLMTGLYVIMTAETPLGTVIALEVLSGIGSGALFEAPLVAIQANMAQGNTAAATAAFGFTRSVAMAMSLVLGSVVFQNGMETRVSSLRAAGLNSTLIDAFSDGNAAASVKLIGTISDAAQQNAVKAAFAWSLRNLWIMYSGISALGLGISLFIAHSHLSTEHTETKTGISEMKRVLGLRDGPNPASGQE